MTNFERAQHEDRAIKFQDASAKLYASGWADTAATTANVARFHLFRALGDSAFMARSKASSKLGEYTVFPCQ